MGIRARRRTYIRRPRTTDTGRERNIYRGGEGEFRESREVGERRVSWRPSHTTTGFTSLIESRFAPDNAPARSRSTRHAGETHSPSFAPSSRSRSRSLAESAGRSAGTPEIMFGRTVQHGGRGTAEGRARRGARDVAPRGADRDIQRRKMRKESGTRNARIERVT